MGRASGTKTPVAGTDEQGHRVVWGGGHHSSNITQVPSGWVFPITHHRLYKAESVAS